MRLLKLLCVIFQALLILFWEWLVSVLNLYVMWGPKSPMINYSSFFGTRKATNHPFTRKFFSNVFIEQFLLFLRPSPIRSSKITHNLVDGRISLQLLIAKVTVAHHFSIAFFRHAMDIF